MAEINPAILNDRNHWRVDLRGLVGGQETVRSYHLHAGSQTIARRDALVKWARDFDDVPFIARAERYASWRVWESREEGECGSS